MYLYPAIDILNGNAVRLRHGDYSKVSVYGEPLSMCDKWASEGAKFIHVVDLNGARGEHDVNVELIKSIALTGKASLQVGGGIRTMSDIIRYFDCGIDRVILGSACIANPKLIEDAVKRYGAGRIICGADAKNGYISVNGWLEQTPVTLTQLCLRMKELGIKTVICTDISRDGALSGSNNRQIRDLIAATKMNIIASGGINSLENIKELVSLGAYGAILGKALYENMFTLKEALSLSEGKNV